MKHRIAFVGFMLLLSAQVYTKTALAQSWEALPVGAGRGSVELIAPHPEWPGALFAGKSGGLYASFDQGKNWKELFNLGVQTEINRLYFASDHQWFLLTSDGVFESKNQGQNWSRIFQGLNREERNALSLTQDPIDEKIFYLGTSGGLFQSRDGAKTWAKDTNGFARKHISVLVTDPETRELFIASDKGLSRFLIPTKRLDHVYQTKSTVDIDLDVLSLESDETHESDSEEMGSELIHSLIVESGPNPFIAIGTARGVLISEDEGNHWERLPLSGFKETNIVDLAYSAKQNRFFAATGKGVYFYDPQMKSWKELYEGLAQTQMNRIALVSSESEILYAAGRDGLYQWVIEIKPNAAREIKIIPDGRWPLLLALFREEPSIRTVQNEAIKYANVSHWKTRRWQWASRFKSLIPSLSAGKSFSKGDSIDLDRGSSADPDTYIIGPRDTNQSWDFDLNWELSDLLFNSSQTSIDSREKSMVELRDDILSEVTRLYFERRRAQAEFILTPPPDIVQHSSALLRLEELAANLDSLTNGYFTKELQKIYAQRPDFEELWGFQEP
jgi:photosystem II stability/assembly factor-like uncharacterized protein